MDADDISKPERLGRQITYLDTRPDITVLGTAFELFGDDIQTKVVTLPTTDKQIRRRLPFVFSICHPTVIFRRKVILKHGGYLGGKHCEDLDLWLRLSRDKAVKFANLREPLFKYRMSLGQIKGVASILFKEALVQNSPYLFSAFVFACLKIFRASKYV